VAIDIQPSNFPRLTPELETTIFRIIQEALTNVLRHSGASKVTVSLIDGQTRFIVAVQDNGKGIPDKVMEFRPEGVGIGIGGMRQRVKELGGELKITNANPGTLVEVAIPAHLVCRKEAIATA
jgi:two-component system NarL family sensor kinase